MSFSIKLKNEEVENETEMKFDVNLNDGMDKVVNHFKISNRYQEYTELAKTFPDGKVESTEDKIKLKEKLDKIVELSNTDSNEMKENGMSKEKNGKMETALDTMLIKGDVPDLRTVSLFLDKSGANIKTLKTSSGKPQQENVKFLESKVRELERKIEDKGLKQYMERKLKQNTPVNKLDREKIQNFILSAGDNYVVSKIRLSNVVSRVVNEYHRDLLSKPRMGPGPSQKRAEIDNDPSFQGFSMR